MIFLIIALFGLIVPNGIFIYWLFTEFNSVTEVVNNKLAIAFIIDAFMAMFLLAYWFAARPIGKVRWYWFIILSIIGGLGFSLPFYWWLNQKFDQVE
jgi:hypothetical protein